jgi:hypothetical protein
MSQSKNGLSPDQLRAVNVLAGAGAGGSEPDGVDAAGCDPEAVAGWLGENAEFIAGLNRAKSVRKERLRADVRSLASQAMVTLRELVSGSEVPPAVRLRASLAILQAADVLKADEIGPTWTKGVQAELDHKRFIESLGG